MVQDLHLGGIPIIRRFPGLPPEILVNYGALIQETIKANKLTPVSKLDVMAPVAKAAEPTMMMYDWADWWWKWGGMKAAHLHYHGEVYALNEAQWREFSSKIVTDLSKKLAGAKNISFTEFGKVADAVNEVI